jgi:tRNA-guanine transglycosylase
MFDFKIIKRNKHLNRRAPINTRARLGILRTPHGIIQTPAFVPVATKGALRGISFEAAKKYGAEIFMANAYHLFHNERYKIIERSGGLHKFLNIKSPLMTDSGGFQVFSLGFGAEHRVGKIADIFPEENNREQPSAQHRLARPPAQDWSASGGSEASGLILGLARPSLRSGHHARPASLSRKRDESPSGMRFAEVARSLKNSGKISVSNLVKINDSGTTFKSSFNGKILQLTPEISIKIQQQLGADIILAFDECTSPLNDYKYTKKAMQRTHNWAIKCLEIFEKNSSSFGKDLREQVLFGIIQGGEYKDLRIESAKFIGSLPFFGFGIGGSLGKSKKDIVKVLKWTIPLLPENKPRHLLGIGEIDDIFNAVECGVDLFDCVIPTRWARHSTAFTYQGRLNLKSAKFLTDKKPIDPKCCCDVCKNYSRAYICHLLREKEIYGIMLLTEHNIAWILNLMKEIRQSIRQNKFEKLKKQLLKYY